MTEYDAARNSMASHALALAECRRMYLAGRLDGETAAQYRLRMTPHPFPPLAKRRKHDLLYSRAGDGCVEVVYHVVGDPAPRVIKQDPWFAVCFAQRHLALALEVA